MTEDDFPDFAEPWKNSDATLIVEERTFHVHQTMLKLSSPFFEALFSDTDFAEGMTKTATLKNKKAADVCDLLQVLYPPHKNVTVEMTDRILPLADELLMWGIKNQCERALLSAGKFTFKSVAMADRYKLRHLREYAVNFITVRYPFRTLLNSDAFTLLDDSTRLKILEGRIRHVYRHLPGRIEALLLLYKDQIRARVVAGIKDSMIEKCDLSPGRGGDAL
ncbi:BTB and MATH domain-containing protein 38-like [Oscarella lobularis]|uniref:BTB and MATH domain-containing protein 38-like n=1 Tax=Oscarella lobularis TaxID=121494 RepID=UPI003313A8E8